MWIPSHLTVGNGPDLERNADVVCVCFCVCVCIMAFSQGMDDWQVHESNTRVGGGNDGDGVTIKHDVWRALADTSGLFCLYSRSLLPL